MGKERKMQRSYAEAAKLVLECRRNKKGRDFEISESVAKIVLKDLRRHGRFFHDVYRAFFFSQEDQTLIPIEPRSSECMLVLARYGINSAESLYKYLVQSLWTEAMIKGAETTVHQLSYYNQQTFTLYVYGGEHQVYHISPEKIELVDNGIDGVLFMSERKIQPFEIKELKDGHTYLDKVLLSKINHANWLLTLDEMKLIVRLWFYSLFFPEIMPTKTILLFLGPKGSGKTTLTRIIGKLLLGKMFNVTPLTKDSRDFDAAITNSVYVAVDNADTAPSWFEDRIAIAATGGTIKMRKYYTNNEEVDFSIRCYMAITSRTPNFRRDDVADRLLIMELKRFKKFKSENNLMAEVFKYRNKVMSEVVYTLQDIVRALRDSGKRCAKVSFRMADFADFSIKIGRSWGIENEVKAALTKIEYLQREFHLESDSIGKLLYMWAEKNQGRELDAAALNSELAKLAKQKGIDYPYKENSKSFAQKLRTLRKDLGDVLQITDRPAHGGIKKYSIRPAQKLKDGGKGGM